MIVGPWRTVGISDPDTVELTTATRRKFTWNVEEAPFCSFELEADEQEALYVWELTHDVMLLDDANVPQFRGRVGTIREQYEPDKATLEVQCTGYRGMLTRRVIFDGDPLIYTQQDQSLIAWDMISRGQARSNGNLGITRGIGQSTGRLRDRTYEPGAVHGELIDMLGEVIDGFDWDVNPDLEFDVYYPIRQRHSDVILDWGGMVAFVSRSWASPSFSNVVRGQGGIRVDEEGNEFPTTPVVATAGNLATAEEGRWETNLAWPDVVEQPTLNEHTATELERRNVRLADISVSLRGGMWEGPDQLFVGDQCELRSPLRGRPPAEPGLTARDVRVLTLELNMSDDGGDPEVRLLVTELDGGL